MGVDLAEVEGGVPQSRPLDDELPIVLCGQVEEGVACVRAEHQPVRRQQVHSVACSLDPGHLQKHIHDILKYLLHCPTLHYFLSSAHFVFVPPPPLFLL